MSQRQSEYPLDLLKLARRVRGVLRRPSSQRDLKGTYVQFVDTLMNRLPHDEAMELAIGGSFDRIGSVELRLLRLYGLKPTDYVIDVGCGSGRLARPLAAYSSGRYLGTDLVPAMVAHARKIVGRADWRFEVIDHIAIPEADGKADVVCFFSVLTHLLHEQSFWYLEEAKRVLKPGGTIAFSFLEFVGADHMPIFRETVAAAKAGSSYPLNVFIERNAIARWAEELALEVIALHGAYDALVPEGVLGQAFCALRKPG